jgi:hypothetical protein
MADFTTKNLSTLNLDDIFGNEVNRPFSWHKLRLFLSKLAADLTFSLGHAPQTIDMADAAKSLIGAATAAANTVVVTSNILLVDANSAGTEDLTFTATAPKGLYVIKNTGGESIIVKNPAGSTILTLITARTGVFAFDGTTLTSLAIVAFA